MDYATTTLGEKELKTFNKVRLHLKIATISDLAIADGSRVDKQILRGYRGGSPSPSRWAYKWTNVPPPTNNERYSWTMALGTILGITASDPSLETNNYRWFHPECVELSCWNFDRSSGNIFEKAEASWVVWEPEVAPQRRTRRTAFYTRTAREIHSIERKDQCRAISVTYQGDKITIESRGRYHIDQEEQREQEPWFLPTDSTPISEIAKDKFMTAVQQGVGFIVADGSYKTGRSSAAVIFQHQKMNEYTEKNNVYAVIIPGHKDEQSSYKGESGGILTGLAYANRLLRLGGITEGKCIIGCDNKGALDASFGWKTPNPNWTCFDLVSEIRNQLRTSPISWKKKHIKGHQDENKTFPELAAEAQANVIVDRKAKDELALGKIPQEGLPQKEDMWLLTCLGHRITGNMEHRLRYYMQETDSRLWWMRKVEFPEEYQDKISWPVYHGYRHTTPKWRNTWSVKFGADILPTRTNLVRRGHSTRHECPCCGESNENALHLFLCTNKEMTKTYDDEMEKISDFLQISTNQEIKKNILLLFQSFRVRDE